VVASSSPRIIVVMYMREAREELPAIPVPPALGTALAICVAATLYLGLLPGKVLEYASRSAADLLH
jgi:NADH:ubiquinone oxidoreductase subunit 2 (subunit N)